MLLLQLAGADWWFLPGGRCEMNENSKESLSRELLEELGEEAGVGRLLWTVENFYSHEGTSYHEVGFYYLAALGADSAHQTAAEWSGQDAGTALTFRWFPIDGLEEVRLFPTFLRKSLRDLPGRTRHLIHADVDQ